MFEPTYLPRSLDVTHFISATYLPNTKKYEYILLGYFRRFRNTISYDKATTRASDQ